MLTFTLDPECRGETVSLLKNEWMWREEGGEKKTMQDGCGVVCGAHLMLD